MQVIELPVKSAIPVYVHWRFFFEDEHILNVKDVYIYVNFIANLVKFSSAPFGIAIVQQVVQERGLRPRAYQVAIKIQHVHIPQPRGYAFERGVVTVAVDVVSVLVVDVPVVTVAVLDVAVFVVVVVSTFE